MLLWIAGGHGLRGRRFRVEVVIDELREGDIRKRANLEEPFFLFFQARALVDDHDPAALGVKVVNLDAGQVVEGSTAVIEVEGRHDHENARVMGGRLCHQSSLSSSRKAGIERPPFSLEDHG
jgi:hypothetical protein